MKSLGEQIHDLHIQKIRSCLHEEKEGFGREGLENYWETQPALDFQASSVVVPGPTDSLSLD